jgi:hypothetical protein
MKLLSLLSALLLSFPNLQAAQQASAPASITSSQAASLLKQSTAALTGSVALSDVTLTGTARRIAGSDDQSGTAVLKALATGASRMDLALSGGQRSEICNSTVTPPAGSWSGPDGVSHPISYHNLMTDPAWFFSAFPISRAFSSSGYATAYIGQETRSGQSVQHVQLWQISTVQTPPGTPTFQHLSQMDFYLDSTTLLPAAITLNVHPDNDALLDIPVEIRFSDYRSVNGAQIPYHIQKFLNNSLLLDFQAQSVTLNSGLTAATFGAL